MRSLQRRKTFLSKETYSGLADKNFSTLSSIIISMGARLIQPLLDDALLFDLLMGHLKASLSEEEAMRLKSSSKQPHERHLALLDLAEKGGTCGYMQLFMCICETFEEAPGHSQAAKILQGK